MQRGACLCICSPLGRSLLPGLKSSKQSPFTSQKHRSFACSSPLLLIHCLRLSNSFLRLFATLYLSTELQWCCSMAGASDPAPLPLSSSTLPLVSAHTSHRHSSSPSLPRRDGTVDRMLCCGEPAANGKRRREWELGRREENPAEKEWHHLCSASVRERERESEGMGGSVNGARAGEKLH